MGLEDVNVVRSEALWFSIGFLVLGVVSGLGTFFQTYMFNVAGVELTARLRGIIFAALTKQEMGYFDDTRNSVGALCARLAGDCASVQGATGTRLGSILLSLSCVIIGIIISLFFSWKMTLVSLISVPVVLASCYYESK